MREAHAGLHLARHKVCVCARARGGSNKTGLSRPPVTYQRMDIPGWMQGEGLPSASLVDAPPRGPFSGERPRASSRRDPLDGDERRRQTAAVHTLGVPRRLPPPPATTRIVRLMEVSAGDPRGASYYQTGPRGRRAPPPHLPPSLQPSAAQSFICRRRYAIDPPAPL